MFKNVFIINIYNINFINIKAIMFIAIKKISKIGNETSPYPSICFIVIRQNKLNNNINNIIPKIK